MNKKIKAYIDEEYTRIYSKLNVSWLKGSKLKKEEISHKGLANSGMEQKMLVDYAFSLIFESNMELRDLIEKSQEKFNFKMKKKEIEEYINRSVENNNSYLNIFEKDLLEYFENKKMPLVESCKSQFNNVRLNNKSELEKIKKELTLMNEGKKSKWLSKEGIIIGILVPVIIFILGIVLA